MPFLEDIPCFSFVARASYGGRDLLAEGGVRGVGRKEDVNEGVRS